MGVITVLHPHQDCLNDNLLQRSPKSKPNSTISKAHKRRDKTKMITDPPATKTLIMGHVKILKRGEPFIDSPLKIQKTTLKNVTKDVPNDRKVQGSSGKTNSKRGEPFDVSSSVLKIQKTTLKNDATVTKDRKVKDLLKEKTNTNSKIKKMNLEDVALCSTNRLGPDPEHMNIADFFFAGSVFVDSPPPSSLPLPGFSTKDFVKEDPTTDLRRMLHLS